MNVSIGDLNIRVYLWILLFTAACTASEANINFAKFPIISLYRISLLGDTQTFAFLHPLHNKSREIILLGLVLAMHLHGFPKFFTYLLGRMMAEV